jgi:hypothetical protein
MKDGITITNPGSQLSAGYAVLLASLVIGALALPFSFVLSLLPAAVLAGWTQIGGL